MTVDSRHAQYAPPPNPPNDTRPDKQPSAASINTTAYLTPLQAYNQ